MPPSGTATSLGRFQAPDPPSAIERIHIYDAERVTLKLVDHEPKIAVLDQEDLHKQGIVCSTFIKGAGDPDALGSCTANTTVEAVSNLLTPEQFVAFITKLGVQAAPNDVYTNTVAGERAAIGFYHACTDQTGQSAQEWPPTDCGSSGPFMFQMLKQLGYVESEQIAHGADNIMSVMQPDGACWGTPWFNSWFEPDGNGFIDGSGSHAAIQAAIQSGVAGGHEIYLSAIEKLVVLPTGHVDPHKTVIRFRNHWGTWGDHGSGRVHLSTLVALGGQIDVRRFTPRPRA